MPNWPVPCMSGGPSS
uniref:Uncharacterized protein n=1 Tax=Arundo donax TaxID=35708 RepID=A0A0A9GBK8_ARUDO